MISITTTMMDGATVEIGAIGSRELLGINAFMGGRETTHTEYVVQLSGDALKISAKPLRLEFDTNVEFRGVMLKYTQALIAQISQNAACNRLHNLENRCARWLLEVRDRLQADEFEMTQEFIGNMLGVNRTTVSKALANLKERGIINCPGPDANSRPAGFGRGRVRMLFRSAG